MCARCLWLCEIGKSWAVCTALCPAYSRALAQLEVPAEVRSCGEIKSSLCVAARGPMGQGSDLSDECRNNAGKQCTPSVACMFFFALLFRFSVVEHKNSDPIQGKTAR